MWLVSAYCLKHTSIDRPCDWIYMFKWIKIIFTGSNCRSKKWLFELLFTGRMHRWVALRGRTGHLSSLIESNTRKSLLLNISSCCGLKRFECEIRFDYRNQSNTKCITDWEMIIRLQWRNIQLANTLLLPLKTLDLFVCCHIRKVFYETNTFYVFKIYY